MHPSRHRVDTQGEPETVAIPKKYLCCIGSAVWIKADRLVHFLHSQILPGNESRSLIDSFRGVVIGIPNLESHALVDLTSAARNVLDRNRANSVLGFASFPLH